MRRSLLTAALACVLVAGVASEAAAAGRGPDCNGARELCQRHLDEVVLPGAHNAMSALDLGWRIPNQTLAIPDQLERGIRALLVDTHYGRLQADGTVRTDDDGQVSVGERGLYLCHVLCEIGASPLVPVLRSIRDFISANRNTVIVIVNEDHVAPGDFAGAVEESGLGDFVYEDDPGPEWPTLRKMIASREQVVVLAERNAGTVPWYHRAYDGVLQETPFSFPAPSLLINPANWPLSCRPNRGGTTGSLFLLNHWSPATPPAVPDPAASAAVNAKNVILGRARECQRLRGRMPTIIAADQVTYGSLFAAVAQLNGLAP